jgi:outer membrane protein assembly factor BamB
VWKFSAGAEVTGTPRCGENAVYVGTKNGTLFALAFDGTCLWQRAVGGAVFSKPLLIGEALLVTTQAARLVVLDAGRGTPLGEFRAASAIYSSPDHDGERVYFGSYGGILYAIHFPSRAAT